MLPILYPVKCFRYRL